MITIIMLGAVSLTSPIPIPGSKAYIMPRTKKCVGDAEQLYYRDDQKVPRDGAGRGSSTISIPDSYDHTKLFCVGLDLYKLVIKKRPTGKFLKARFLMKMVMVL